MAEFEARWADKTPPHGMNRIRSNGATFLGIMALALGIAVLATLLNFTKSLVRSHEWPTVVAQITAVRETCTYSFKYPWEKFDQHKTVYCDDKSANEALVADWWKGPTIMQQLSVAYDLEGKILQTTVDDWPSSENKTGNTKLIRHSSVEPQLVEVAAKSDSQRKGALEVSVAFGMLGLIFLGLRIWLKRVVQANSIS